MINENMSMYVSTINNKKQSYTHIYIYMQSVVLIDALVAFLKLCQLF